MKTMNVFHCQSKHVESEIFGISIVFIHVHHYIQHTWNFSHQELGLVDVSMWCFVQQSESTVYIIRFYLDFTLKITPLAV